ncbi:MAG: 4Fe-4S binding protein [Chloroflexota bacterium]
MSLFDAAERFAAMDHSQVILDAERCLHSQYQNSDCEACYSICPVVAITPGKPPSLKVETCESCLACLPACPVNAYHADDAVASLLNCVTRLDTKAVELLCEMHSRPETGIADSTGLRVRGCLAGLGNGTYLLLASLGVKKIISRTDACKACSWSRLSKQIERQVFLSSQFLAAWGEISSISCTPSDGVMVERPLWESTNPPLSRRDLFRMMARQGQIALARATEEGHNGKDKKVGRDRLRTTNAVRNLTGENAVPSTVCENFEFASLKVSEACTACGACANVCPTGALQFEITNTNRNFSLTFSATDCIGCDICESVCAPAAIAIDHQPTLKDVFGSVTPEVVQEGDLVRCTQCNILMAARTGVKLCPLCAYRRKNPFGSKIPPGMKLPGLPVNRKSTS